MYFCDEICIFVGMIHFPLDCISWFESQWRGLKIHTGGRKLGGAMFRNYLVQILQEENGNVYHRYTYATNESVKVKYKNIGVSFSFLETLKIYTVKNEQLK